MLGLFRRCIRYFYQIWIGRFSRSVQVSDLQKSAIIFSPHQDDETLGCGGTVLFKKKYGAGVKIVFMTDGSASHSHLIAAENLKSIRHQEALNACQSLGVAPSDVVFLDYEDGQLSNHTSEAIDRVINLLRTYRPEEVYIPYRGETHPDHYATFAIVREALSRSGRSTVVYEYPIWYWRHWPWVPLTGSLYERKSLLKASIRAGFGIRALATFNCLVPILPMLNLKRDALNHHRSQLTRLVSSPDWITLGDVSKGEFLECLLQPQEVFFRYQLPDR